jgi:hypothetical protein
VKNTDMVIAVDDNDSMSLVRLFNEPAGQKYLKDELKIKQDVIDNLNLMGISGVANMLSAIKFAKYYELGEDDIILTVFTDSMELYQSRLKEMEEKFGEYDRVDAAVDYNTHLKGQTIDYLEELTYESRKRIHNLKYYTWVEQQGKDVEELNAQWYDYDNYWGSIHNMTGKIDELIKEFNKKVGLLD